MRLRRLDLHHFRNLGIQRLEFPPEGVAIIGDNAQGKSNLLESIYYLETLRSFRGARDEQLVAFGETVFRVVGEVVDDDGSLEVAAAFERTGKRKKATLGGAEPPRLGDALGRLAAVVFSPGDVDLVSGGPAERRRFLDIVLSLNQPGYLEELQTYRRVLLRRNAAWKAGHGAAAVRAWDGALIRSGARVMAARRRWVERHEDAFSEYYRAVSGDEGAHLAYRPSVPALREVDGVGAWSDDEVGEAFAEALAEAAEREVRMATTVVGPHRDDLRIRQGGADALDLRQYGSGGQRRTAALALRLVEARTVREARGAEPVVLLDDVFAELDEGRSERVLALMEREEQGQVVLTAPKEADIRLRRDDLPRWRIAGGRIEA